MKNQKNEKRLDELIFRTINTAKPQFDAEKWKQKYPEEFQLLTSPNRQSSARQPNLWRTIMKTRITKSAVAAGVIIAVIIGLNYFGGSINVASVAWADVVKPILNARTAIYDTVVGEEGKSPVIRDMVMGSRIRRTLSNMDTISIIDLETSKILTLDPKEKKAVYIDLKGLPQIPNQLEMLQNVITKLQDSPHFVVEELGEQQIEGQTAIGFRAKYPRAELIIWADPETALPVRIEYKLGQFFAICKNFQFDVDMDESLFSMDVPEGYTVQETEIDLLGATEEDFIEGLRVWAEVLLDGEFPENVSVEYFIKQAPIIEKKFTQLELADDEELELEMKLQRHLLFTRFFKGRGKWYYSGRGVQLGDADTAIFWYRPKGSKTYRVIYGDLTVEDVAPEDLPEPLPPEEAKESIGYQQWSKSDFVGSQKDQWHITASGNIIVHSFITLTKGPQNTTVMPITLPYSSGILESVTLGETKLPYSQLNEGEYEVELPAEKLFDGQTSIECIWTLSLDALEKVKYGYRTKLQSLIPVGSYKLTVILDPDCNFEHTKDSSKRKIVPFTWGSDSAKMHFGSCGLLIQKSD